MQIRKVPPSTKKYATYPLLPAKIVTTTKKTQKKTKCNIALLHNKIFKSSNLGSKILLNRQSQKSTELLSVIKFRAQTFIKSQKLPPKKIDGHTKKYCTRMWLYVVVAGDRLVNSAMPFF